MIYVLATITVKNFAALAEFETRALALAEKYSGKLIAAFETVRNDDDSGTEVHLLRFDNTESLTQYQQDSELKLLSELRSAAIAATTIVVSETPKSY